MANHPNLGLKYIVGVQHFSNQGLGWERLSSDMGGSETHEMTKAQADEFASKRDVTTTEVKVYDQFGDVLAMAGRREAKLHWFR